MLCTANTSFTFGNFWRFFFPQKYFWPEVGWISWCKLKIWTHLSTVLCLSEVKQVSLSEGCEGKIQLQELLLSLWHVLPNSACPLCRHQTPEMETYDRNLWQRNWGQPLANSSPAGRNKGIVCPPELRLVLWTLAMTVVDPNQKHWIVSLLDSVLVVGLEDANKQVHNSSLSDGSKYFSSSFTHTQTRPFPPVIFTYQMVIVGLLLINYIWNIATGVMNDRVYPDHIQMQRTHTESSLIKAL